VKGRLRRDLGQEMIFEKGVPHLSMRTVKRNTMLISATLCKALSFRTGVKPARALRIGVPGTRDFGFAHAGVVISARVAWRNLLRCSSHSPKLVAGQSHEDDGKIPIPYFAPHDVAEIGSLK
jgi:hypothetical protein